MVSYASRMLCHLYSAILPGDLGIPAPQRVMGVRWRGWFLTPMVQPSAPIAHLGTFPASTYPADSHGIHSSAGA